MRVSRDFADLEIRLYGLQDGYYPVDLSLNYKQPYGAGRHNPARSDLHRRVANLGQALFERLLVDSALQNVWSENRSQYTLRRVRFRSDDAAPERFTLPCQPLCERDVGPPVLNLNTFPSTLLSTHLTHTRQSDRQYPSKCLIEVTTQAACHWEIQWG